MKVNLSAGGVLAVAGLGVVALLWVKRGAIGQAAASAAGAVVTAVNPADSGNLVNRGVSAIGQAATGDSSWTLGGALARLTGADRDAEIRLMLEGKTAAPTPADPLAVRYDYWATGGASSGSGSGSMLAGPSFEQLAGLELTKWPT